VLFKAVARLIAEWPDLEPELQTMIERYKKQSRS
jgi:hypothetical protein